MTRLLVSVTSAAEAVIARDHGADLIDVKDPTRGSLGAHSPYIWREVIAAVGKDKPVSAALGELLGDDAIAHAHETCGLHFAKVGLAHCRERADWEDRWLNWRSALPERTTPVAVMYADWELSGAIAPATVLWRLVMHHHCPAVLIDTFDKQQGSLLQLWRSELLAGMCQLIRRAGAKLVLAGSLQLRDLPLVLELQPDYVAVRGAVCRDSRSGPIDGALVREWSRALAAARQ